jgi:DNA (cytosine-5)-methyltransferase 1
LALNRRRKPTAVDLFAGCGGLTVGLKAAGFRVLGAVELDRLAAETYSMNHPSTVLWRRDIRTLDAERVKRRLNLAEGELDLLAGCPPCQAYSTMRTLNGGVSVIDEDQDLIFEFLRLVEGLLPKAVMVENVPGLADDCRLLDFWLRLRELGYLPRHYVLNASDYGVAQRRRRMVLLAARGADIPAAVPDPIRKHVVDVIGGLPAPGLSGDPAHDVKERRSPRIQAMIELIPPDGGGRMDLPQEWWLACHKRSDGFKDVYGRMAWNDVAPTITGGFVNPSKGRFLHPEQHRTITPREAALLQGFPQTYRFPMARGKFPVAELIGNAFPPAFVERQAAQVIAYLQRGAA